MPHDKNGAELKVGDKVTVECEITSICEGEFCITDLKTVEVMPGNKQPSTISAINAKQLVKVGLVLLALFLLSGTASAQEQFVVVNKTVPAFTVVNRIPAKSSCICGPSCACPAGVCPACPTAAPVSVLAPLALASASCASGQCAAPAATVRGLGAVRGFGLFRRR